MPGLHQDLDLAASGGLFPKAPTNLQAASAKIF